MRDVLERERELAELAAALERATRGSGGVVTVEGQTGIGKTALLAAARREAAARGIATLHARGGALERTFAFGVIRQLFERELLGDRRTELLRDAAALAAPALGLEAGAGPEPVDASFSVVHGLYWLVANLALEGPVLLAIDDVHWADAPSLRALEYIAARLDELPVLAVLAVGPREPATGPLDELLAKAQATLRPEPLSAAGVGALLGTAADPAVLAAARRATGGNPFLVTELARAIAAAEARGARIEPDAIARLGSQAVTRPTLLRLARLPGACRQVARAVAVLGAHAELRYAAALAGLELDEAAGAAEGLATAQILDAGRPLAFVHSVVETCVYEDMTAAERACMHAQAAALLRNAGLRPGELAPHLLATEPAGDAEVVALLRAAAGEVLRQGAPDLAERYLRRALREPPAASEMADVLGELGNAEWLLGAEPARAVEHLGEALERTRDPARRPARALALHRALFATGRLLDAYQLIEREVAQLAGTAEAEELLRMEAELASIGLLHPATAAHVNERLAHFEALEGSTPAELLQIANVACWKWAAGTAEETVAFGERALARARTQAADPADSIPIYEALWVLCYADAHDVALSVLDDTLADAQARGSIFGISTTCTLRALIALQRGDVTTAEHEARTATVLPGLSAFVRPPLFGTLALALVARGELSEAEWAIAESGCGPDLPEFVCLNPVFYARGMLRLAQGRHADALADFSEFGERCRRINLRNPGDPWRLGAAEALLALGCAGEAAALADEQLELARSWGTSSAIGIALHGHALAHGGEPEALAVAARTLAASPARLAHARCLVDLGAALRRANRRADARQTLQEGLELAHRCGARTLAERAHEELRVAGARPRRLMFSGPDALTPSERRVAELAADGRSSREIAQALFVTAKTVDNHLGRIYTKLGISSRGELAAALRGERPAGAAAPEPLPAAG